MVYELLIIGGGILFGLVGFIIGAILVHRAYKASPSLMHYKKIVDILTLRKLHSKLYSEELYGGKSSKKETPIEHYESMRDKLTIRKKEKAEPLSEGLGLGGISIGNLIGGFIAILIGVTLIPIVAQQVNQVTNSTTAASQSLTAIAGMIPIMFALTIAGIAIAIVFSTLRNTGMV